MLNVEQIAREIVGREGGFVNDPDDPGGPTNLGVTLKTLRKYGHDLDGDADIDIHDLKQLAPDQAADLFLKHYFTAPGLGTLPTRIQASVFDMYVHAGRNAIKILQRLLVQMGQAVKVDGVVGPQTASAAASAAALAPDHFVDAYGIARRNFYLRLADQRPASRKYAQTRSGGKGGWVKRAEEFMSPRYHLTEHEFAARVAKWA